MKTIEHDPRWPRWMNSLLNKLAVDTRRITSRAVARGPWGVYRADTTPYWIDERDMVVLVRNPWTNHLEIASQYQSQVWNARRFHRRVYVDGKLRGLCWSWRPAGARYKHTVILGYKINGRLALTVRLWHSDESSARGTTGPNYGQAVGDEWGPA